ncbi:MAG: phosphatidylserine decarboxylase [Granulosicoccaceae bacterium]|jgi:phosphatidylserine decarboxylase
MIKHYSLIAREGRPFIVLAFLFAAVLVYLYGWLLTMPVWLLPLLLMYMFRDPTREVPADPLGIVSPVDGHVTSIDRVHDHYLDRDAVRIRIRMNPFGVYTTRSPIEGKVMHQWYITDKTQLRAGDPAFAQWIQTDEGEDLLIAMYRAPIVHHPHCFVQTGERVGQGQRCGFINFGAHIEMFLPADARIHAVSGQTVLGGVTVLSDFAGG